MEVGTYPARFTSGVATEPSNIPHCPLEVGTPTVYLITTSEVTMANMQPQPCPRLIEINLNLMLVVTPRLVCTIVPNRGRVRHSHLWMTSMVSLASLSLQLEENLDIRTIQVLREVRGKRHDQECPAPSQLMP